MDSPRVAVVQQAPAPEIAPVEFNKLRWRCRRGMRELDMVLERFLARDFAALDAESREAFSALLDTTDPELYDWLLGRTLPPTAAFADLIERLKAHRVRT